MKAATELEAAAAKAAAELEAAAHVGVMEEAV